MAHVTLWQGRPLDEYTKPELIRIVEQLGRMLTNEYERAQHENAMTRAASPRRMCNTRRGLLSKQGRNDADV